MLEDLETIADDVVDYGWKLENLEISWVPTFRAWEGEMFIEN